MQAKRIQVEIDVTVAGGTSTTTVIEAPLTPREEINYHNIHGSFIVEPVVQDANASGVWCLYVIPEGGSAIQWSEVTVQSELNNRFIIAIGVWAATNQTPFISPDINPKTSRTLNAGDKLALGVSIENVTTGNSLMNVILAAHTTRK